MKHLLLLLVVCGGCSTASVQRTLPDGSSIKAWTVRALWKTEDFRLKVVTVDGVIIEVAVGTTKTDEKSVKAVTEGVTTGLLKGALPTP